MGGSSKKKQTQEQKVLIDPVLDEAVHGTGGVVPEATRLFNEGLIAPAPPSLKQVEGTFNQASQTGNELIDPALQASETALAGGQENPYLQSQMDAMQANIQRNVTRDTTTEAAMAGRFGSQAQRGLTAERIGSQSQPMMNMIQQDLARRRQQQAQATMDAPQLGAAKSQDLAQQGLLAEAAAAVDKQQQSARAEGLMGLAGVLGSAAVGGIPDSDPAPTKARNNEKWEAFMARRRGNRVTPTFSQR